MSKPEVKSDPRLTTKILAAMTLGKPLHKLEALCEKQKTVSTGRVVRMIEEAQDILKDYAYTINSESDDASAADKARIAELEDRHTVIEQSLGLRIAELEQLAERLKQEAQIHAMEARTANATIAEIYQVVSGGKGEPGNWHGAVLVRECIGELLGLLRESSAAMEAAHDSMFTQCLSNPVMNAWGQKVDVTLINALSQFATRINTTISKHSPQGKEGGA